MRKDLIVPVLALSYFAQVSASNMFAPVLAPLAATFGISTGRAGQIGAVAPLSWALLAPVVFSGILPLALAALVASANGLAFRLRRVRLYHRCRNSEGAHASARPTMGQ